MTPEQQQRGEADLRESAATPPAGRGPVRLRGAFANRLKRTNLLILVLALGLGFAISTQVRQTREQGLESLRQQDLVALLDTVTQQGVRLGEELRDLQRTEDALVSGASSSAEALQVARERAQTLAILAGTAPARGPGLRITITDPSGKVGSTVLLDALQELRDAGAEVVQIGPVRVVAQTYFSDTDSGIAVSDTPLTAPYVVLAIGDPHTMSAALEIPGGVGETVRGLGGGLDVETRDALTITAVTQKLSPRFATPVPSGSPSPTS